jgi:hypothetical protein
MAIIKRQYPLKDEDAGDIKSLIKKVNHEFDNILKHVNKMPLDSQGQQQTYIYNIENIGSSGSVNMVEIPLTYDKTAFGVTMKGKLLWIILSVTTAFTSRTKLRVMYGTTTIIHEDWANRLNVLGNTAFSVPLDVNGNLSFSIIGSPTVGAGKIILVTA